MAAYFHHPFVFDPSVFSPITLSDTTNSPYFYQNNYQFDPPLNNVSSDHTINVDTISQGALSNLTDSSSPSQSQSQKSVDKSVLETSVDHQISQCPKGPKPVGNKRKLKDCSNSSVQTKKQKKKKKEELAEAAPAGYIHVRARRGQATDSHSLAERVRREKISERMKQLQSLVPGCDKITGKALMLDEIINYVHSLQYQVEFLSMKLGCENPMLYDFGMDLDSFMVRPVQSLNSLEIGGQNSNYNYPVVDTAFLLQQAHFSQGNGQVINQAPTHNQLSSSNLGCFHI